MVGLVALFAAGWAWADEPAINQRFPVEGRSSVSPPIVLSPIHECARFVKVSGFVPKAIVRIFANGSEPIGTDNPKHGSAEIKLTRPLVLGDVITATQTIGSIPSDHSYDPVTVTAYPAITKPVVVPEIYECGRVVPVGNLVASTHIEVSDLDAPRRFLGPENQPAIGSRSSRVSW
jgi:hypothetical protein